VRPARPIRRTVVTVNCIQHLIKCKLSRFCQHSTFVHHVTTEISDLSVGVRLLFF
jgi:hypothetical protein